MWGGTLAPASHLSARTKEANTLSFWLRSVSGLSNSRIAPLFRTITRSALRMVCTRCWVGRRGCLVWWQEGRGALCSRSLEEIRVSAPSTSLFLEP